MERDHVRAIQNTTTAEGKIAVYAASLAAILPRTAPILAAIRDAAVTDPQCNTLYVEITQRRAATMPLLVATCARPDRCARTSPTTTRPRFVWSMNAAEYYVLLVQERAWTPAKFGSHLADAWRGLLLAHPADNGTTAPKSVP